MSWNAVNLFPEKEFSVESIKALFSVNLRVHGNPLKTWDFWRDNGTTGYLRQNQKVEPNPTG